MTINPGDPLLVPASASGQFLKDDGTYDTPAGGGDVVGPGSSTDNAIARFHETSGKVIQDYTSNPPTISDSGDVNIDGDLDVENIVVSGLVDGEDVADHVASKSANAVLGHVVVENASKIDVDGNGKLTLGSDVLLEVDLEGAPTEDLATKAPTSEWAFDHNAKAATDAVQGHATTAQITKLDAIAESADVTGSNTPQAHAASHRSGGGDVAYVPRTYIWLVKGDVEVGEEQGVTFRMKRTTTVEDVELHVKTAPTDAALIIDINEDGTTIFSTEPEIDAAGTTEDGNHAFDDTSIAAGAELTMDVVQIGSSDPGADLTVLLHCKEPVI